MKLPRMTATREALEHFRPNSQGDERQTLGAAWDEIAAYEKLAEEAASSVDIGDEINRCRICWEAWDKHDDDCPVGVLRKENNEHRHA